MLLPSTLTSEMPFWIPICPGPITPKGPVHVPLGTYDTTLVPLTITDNELDGWHEPLRRFSRVQVDEQPSPFATLPSSHCSPSSTTPLPHGKQPVDAEQAPVDGMQVPAIAQPSDGVQTIDVWTTPAMGSQVSVVQRFASSTTSGVPAKQTPIPSQVSAPLQRSASAQLAPEGLGAIVHPVAGSHTACRQTSVIMTVGGSGGVPAVQVPC